MQPHFVINIGRQFGSGAKQIGELIAQRLGIPLYDKELINLAAVESGYTPELFEQADEKERKGSLSALIGYFRTPLSGNYYCAENPLSNDSLFRIQSEVIRNRAKQESCIFVGRCADYILRDHPQAINLFFTADEQARIDRIVARNGSTEAEAKQCMERTDAQRARYYNYYTGGEWGRAAQYDLTINTSHLSDEASVELVIAYLEKRLKTTITR